MRETRSGTGNSEEHSVGDSANGYERLVAWQRAMSLVEGVYSATRVMPADERFGLTNQMRRAAVSIPSNIAEGYGRGTTIDFLRFLRISRGSIAELQTQILIARRLGMLEDDPGLSALLAETARILQGLIYAMERRAAYNSKSS